MNIKIYIQYIRLDLIKTHAEILAWFETDPEIQNYRPKDQGWTIAEILEHISLTSKFLLLLIDKGVKKSLNNSKGLNMEKELQNFQYDFGDLLKVQIPSSFEWMRPDHMVPTGEQSDFLTKDLIADQLRQCLNHLDLLKNGEGLLHKTTMSVNDLGNLNVYEYIYFLVLHAKRHIVQMEENVREYKDVR